VLGRLADLPLGYLHLMVPQSNSTRTVTVEERLTALRLIRDHYSKTMIANGGVDQSSGNAVIAEGLAELVSYAEPFVANPDLPVRFARHVPLADGDRATFYQGAPAATWTTRRR
jgi:N-ethylmaleimide reductase